MTTLNEIQGMSFEEFNFRFKAGYASVDYDTTKDLLEFAEILYCDSETLSDRIFELELQIEDLKKGEIN